MNDKQSFDYYENFKKFINKYELILADTWRKADPQKKQQISEHNYKKFILGDLEWNEYIQQIKQDASLDEDLIKLINFNFQNERFKYCDFRGYEIECLVSFNGCDFLNETDFSMTKFKQVTMFKNCVFHEKLESSYINAEKEVSFQNTIFNKGIYITNSVFNTHLVFLESTFEHECYLSLCTFKGALNFGNSSFNKYLPDLRQSVFSHMPETADFYFDEKEILKTIAGVEAEDRKEYSSILRKLKSISFHQNNHLLEQKFFSMEMESIKHNKKTLEKIPYYLYKFYSNYGMSIKKPLYALFGVFLIFFVFTFTSFSNEKAQCLGSYYPNEILSIQRTLPFGLGFEKKTIEAAKKCLYVNGVPSFSIQMIAILQVSISYILWFLFFLAIRNLFKIK
ncbi:pentapeptide repeat-containing protein [Marinicella sp. W31]|uniref:pentapeptide repeat-containing protein n=1 Tax=Marinicella sp. W31 TaxID=3023713 RepID=UPI003756AD4C